MPHLSGHCTCGRAQHYPKGATVGAKWKCYGCGAIWTLVPHGTGTGTLNRTKSRPPRRGSGSNSTSGSGSSPKTSSRPPGGGCGTLILGVALLVGGGWFVLNKTSAAASPEVVEAKTLTAERGGAP